MGKRILLVEDESSLSEVISDNLESEGYSVTVAANGKDALKIFKGGRFDLVLLDVMLPELDGFRVCESIRLTDRETPILILSAKGEGADRVQGLKLGADDYLSKPFNLEELLLRVEKLMARAGEKKVYSTTDVFSFGGNKAWFGQFRAQNFKGQEISLTKKEAGLLKLLTDHPGEVVSREMILETVWGYDVYPSTRTIDNFILSFRKIFEKDPKNPLHFLSVRGVGYRFEK